MTAPVMIECKRCKKEIPADLLIYLYKPNTNHKRVVCPICHNSELKKSKYDIERVATEIVDGLRIRAGTNITINGWSFVAMEDAALDVDTDILCNPNGNIRFWCKVVNILEDGDAGYIEFSVPRKVFFTEDFDYLSYFDVYDEDYVYEDELNRMGYWDREANLSKKSRPKGFLFRGKK